MNQAVPWFFVFLVDCSFLKNNVCQLWTSWSLTFVVNIPTKILQNIFCFKLFWVYDWITHKTICFDWWIHYPFMLNAWSLTWEWPNLNRLRSDWLQTTMTHFSHFTKIILFYQKGKIKISKKIGKNNFYLVLH